jgi:hypothetical protein
MTASSSIERTVDFGSFGPVGRSAAELRFFHLATVFWLTRIDWPEPSGSLDYRRTAAVVVALPCRIWTIEHPSIPRKIMHHQNPGSNT